MYMYSYRMHGSSSTRALGKLSTAEPWTCEVTLSKRLCKRYCTPAGQVTASSSTLYNWGPSRVTIASTRMCGPLRGVCAFMPTPYMPTPHMPTKR